MRNITILKGSGISCSSMRTSGLDVDCGIGGPILPEKPLKGRNDSHIIENGGSELGHEPSHFIDQKLGPGYGGIEQLGPGLKRVDRGRFRCRS